MSSASKTLCFLALCAVIPTLYAANPCLNGGYPQPRDGIGGTGNGPQIEDGSGTGGTGLVPWVSGSNDGNGMGGTGHDPLQEEGSGIGGTGHTPWKEAIDGHGMGGTGNRPSPDGSGVGGTGHDTEVEGVITGFASVCVNGLELHYQPTTPVAINGRAGSPKDLAVGQVVRAQARGTGDQLAISRLQVRHIMVAPLQDISNGRAQAMGQTIVIDKAARIPTGLKPGQKVAVSGFVSAGGVILATRLDAAPADSPDSITGEVSQNDKGRAVVAGVPVEGLGPDLKSGESVRAEGRFNNGRFQADRLERDDSLTPADRFVIQGPVRETGRDKLKISGRDLALGQSVSVKRELPQAGQWVRVEGQRRGKELVIEKIEVKERILPDHKGENERSQKNRAGLAKREARSSSERSERSERDERDERSQESESRERNESNERAEIEKPEKQESPEKPEKFEAPEKPEAPERREIERPEYERPEYERPEYERPEYERPEYERPEYERPEYERPEYD